MTRWLRRALLCAVAAGGVLVIGTTSASADEGSVDATLTASAEAAEAAADVGLDVVLTADAEHTERADATADVGLNVGLAPNAGPAEDGEATADVGLDVGIGLDLPDLPAASLAHVGSCACAEPGADANDEGPGEAGDGDDLATGGDGTGTIGGTGGDGTDGNVGAGTASESIGTNGGTTDQVLVADDHASPSSGTGVQTQAASEDGSKSGDPDPVGGKDGKDGKDGDASDDGAAGGSVDGPADGMLGGLIDVTTEDGSFGLAVGNPVDIVGADDETIGSPIGVPIGARSVCRTQFALAALEGLDIIDACGAGSVEESVAEDVGRLALGVDVDGSASPGGTADDPSSTDGLVQAGLGLVDRSTADVGLDAGATLDVDLGDTDGGSAPTAGGTIAVDLAATAGADDVPTDLGLNLSAALGIG